MFDRCVSIIGDSAYHNRQPAQLQQALKKVKKNLAHE